MARGRSFGDITMGKDLKVLKKENNGDRFQIWGTYRFQEKRRAKERSVGDRMMGKNASFAKGRQRGRGEFWRMCFGSKCGENGDFRKTKHLERVFGRNRHRGKEVFGYRKVKVLGRSIWHSIFMRVLGKKLRVRWICVINRLKNKYFYQRGFWG